MQTNDTPVNVLIPNYSPGVFNDEYQNNPSLSTHQIINQGKAPEANLSNTKHIIKSSNINKEELSATLSNLRYNIEKHIRMINSSDQPNNLSQTDEILQQVKEILQVINHTPANPSLSSTSYFCMPMTDDWFITKSFIFQRHLSSSINLSEELINCVRMEEKERNRVCQEYKHLLDLVKQRDQEISDRLKILNEFYEELLKMNQIHLIKDLLNSHVWNMLFKSTDEIEHLCDKMIDSRTNVSLLEVNSIFKRYLSTEEASVHDEKELTSPIKSKRRY